MRYVSWAALYEGNSDASYLDIVIYRLMSEMVRRGPYDVAIPENPIRLRERDIGKFSIEACRISDSFDILFLHLDAGGRNISERIHQQANEYFISLSETCGWPEDRCVLVSPKHETEAWVLADPSAVCDALGYRGNPGAVGLPGTAAEAERITDPKGCLQMAVGQIRGSRSNNFAIHQVFASIAQRQRFASLRNSVSFSEFECKLHSALTDLRVV